MVVIAWEPVRDPGMPLRLPMLCEASGTADWLGGIGMGAALAAAMDSVSRLETGVSF